jgi:hypothetical protein
MTDSPNRALVRRALDELKPYLKAYVDQHLAGHARARRPTKPDASAYLASILVNWDLVFARHLSTTVRNYVFELKEIRNRWAHEEDIADDEAQHAAATARLFAKAIGAPADVVNRLRELSAIEADHPRMVASSDRAPKTARETSRAVRTQPRIDAHGTILNADELTAVEVAGKRVLCPGCGGKVFEMWPGGWDAHAAHVCHGATGPTEEVRKADFRRKFGHLFRGDGVAAAPSKQRDVMRKLWAIHEPDEDRTIREYAAAERRGEVGRTRNTYDISPEEYARRLLADGLHKGWLRRRADSRA